MIVTMQELVRDENKKREQMKFQKQTITNDRLVASAWTEVIYRKTRIFARDDL